MRIKRVLSFVLSFLMLMSILPLSTFITIGAKAEVVDVESSSSINIGDRITLGTYLGESIAWRCVSIDENGPLMLSEKILCFKSFDAKGNHGDYFRNKEGTNNWKESCLRHWLNSEGTVDWSDRPATPNAEKVFNGYNPYSNELGFLSSFSARELNMVKEVEQKTYLNELDSKQADGGTKEYATPTGSFATAFSNLESAGSNKWYQLTADKFFLLNHEQAAAAYENMGVDYLTATATVSAVTNDTSKTTVVETPYKWWLRTPGTAGISYEIVSAIGTNGEVELLSGLSVTGGSTYHSVGVRPAFYLNVDDYGEDSPLPDQDKVTNNHKKEYGGHYYQLFDISLTWEEAKEECENLGGHLVTITSENEQAFLETLITTGEKNCYWMGAEKTTGNWKWVTGEDFSYTNWKTQEPNNENNIENYLEAFSKVYKDIKPGQWNDITFDGTNGKKDNDFYSGNSIGFICEWDNGAIETIRDTTPFDLKTDGYSFANSMPAFEYNIFSKLPLEAYMAVYGAKGKQLRKSDSTWNGSCFGMAATAALFNEGLLDIDDYIYNATSLNVSAYSGLKKDLLSGEYFNYIDKNNEVRKLIDRYHIWQNSTHGKNWCNQIAWQVANADANQVAGNLSNVFKYFDNYIVGFWWPDGGHAVVIDSSRTPIDLGGGWYRIYIYDPNNPYFGYFNGKNAESYYDYAQLRYIEVNVITNHWRVDVGINGDRSPVRVGYDDNDNYISGCELRALDFSSLPTSFDGSAEWYYSSNSANTTNLCCANATIFDTNGNIVFQVVNNKTLYVDAAITVEAKTGLLNDNIINSYIIELPFDEFTIDFQSEGTAQVFNEEYAYGLVSDAAGSATVTTSNGITVNGNESSTVDVVMEHVKDDNTFTSVNVIVENDGQNPTHISLDNNNVLNVDTANDSFDAMVYWDGQENEYLIENVTKSEIANTDITEYAQQTGEIIPNDIVDADIAFQNVFIYDENIKTINPVVKYQGKTLELGIDYIIDGSTSETAIGAYSVTVIGQGNYCGSLVIKYEIIPPLSFKGASLSLQHNLAINYKVDKALFEEIGYTEPYVVVELDGEVTVLTEYTESGECYVFSFSGAAKDQTVKATLYATFEEALCCSHTEEYNLSDYTAVVVTGDSGMEGFAEIGSAIQASSGDGSSYITLQKDVDTDVAVDRDVYLDLNGYSITGTVTVAHGCTLYGMDTKTDDYTVEDGDGYGKISNVNGVVEGLPEEFALVDDGYLRVTEDDGISFHRVNLDLTHMTLRAVVDGVCSPSVYYKSNFMGDELVADAVTQYGVALSVREMPAVDNLETACKYSAYENVQGEIDQFKPGSIGNSGNGTLLKGIMKATNAALINHRNANMGVYGRAYILTEDGQYLFGSGCQRTLKQQTEAADMYWSTFSAEQQSVLIAMYETYISVMKNWNIPNIISAAAQRR